MSRLYTMFQRRSTKNYQHTGVGLGLSYSKAIIQKMGGQINCKSEPKRGTEFCFSVQAMKKSGDEGLAHQEEIQHQFKIAKLIENNFNPTQRRETNDKLVEIQVEHSRAVNQSRQLHLPLDTVKKRLHFAPIRLNKSCLELPQSQQM